MPNHPVFAGLGRRHGFDRFRIQKTAIVTRLFLQPHQQTKGQPVQLQRSFDLQLVHDRSEMLVSGTAGLGPIACICSPPSLAVRTERGLQSAGRLICDRLLEFPTRICRASFLRDKSRAPRQFLACTVNTYDCLLPHSSLFTSVVSLGVRISRCRLTSFQRHESRRHTHHQRVARGADGLHQSQILQRRIAFQ